MGNTATWALPYPELADPADVPLDMKELCERLDAVLSQVKSGGAIPGEIRAWAGAVVPAAGYGRWVWADGTAYDEVTYPQAAANIAAGWKVHNGKPDPGVGKFRVPDLRGCVLTGLDAMPGGARANRITRAGADAVGGASGAEYHTLAVAEMPSHGHGVNDPTHAHTISDPGHSHTLNDPNVTFWDSINTPGNSGGWIVSNNRQLGINAAGTGIGVSGGYSGLSIQAAGGGGAHENLPPATFVPYIVKLDD